MENKKSKESDSALRSHVAAELGLKRIFNNNLIGAIDCFHKALFYNPNNYAHHLNRSYCYLMANKNSLAFNDAKYVIQNSKNLNYLFVAYLRAGMALCGLEEYQEAEVYLKQAIDINSDSHYAKRELLKVKVAHIVRMGFGEREAILALQKYSLTLEAVNYLVVCSKYKTVDDTGNLNKNYDEPVNYNGYVDSSDEDDVPSNTDLVNIILEYTPGITQLQPISAQLNNLC